MTTSPLTTRRRDFALEVVKKLRAAGFQALFAGGCVRDLLLNLDPTDYDVATDARPEQVLPLFRRVLEVGMSFGVVRVVGPGPVGDVEVATFRSDGTYLDGRRPESVVFSTPEEDAARRDFTINGMFYDPVLEQVIDYVGGRADLESRLLRAIGDPFERFAEDKLRLLRAARFAARFDLEIEARTWEAIREMAPNIRVVSVERIAQEFRKMLTHPNRSRALRLTQDSGLLNVVLPPVAELDGFSINGEDAWHRALRVQELLPRDAGFPLAFAALLRDVGKSASRQTDGSSFPGHAHLAARTAERLGRELRLSNEEIEQTVWLVEHHESLVEAEVLPDSTLKRLLASPGIQDLFTLHRAIAIASGRDTAHVDFAEHYLRDEPRGPINPKPLLTGFDLMNQGLKPGPSFSAYLHEIRNAQLDRVINSREEALVWLKARIDGSKASEQ